MKLYFVELVSFEGTDPNDGERVEIRLGDAFYANRRKLAQARRRLKKWIANGWTFETTEHDLPITRRQKHLYVLNHEYTTSDGTWFYYSFKPQTNVRKCKTQQAELSSDPKYERREERRYSQKNGGWFIEKYEIVY